MPSFLHAQARSSRPAPGGARAPLLLSLVLVLALLLRGWLALQDRSADALDAQQPAPAAVPTAAIDVAAVRSLGLFGGATARQRPSLANLATTELDLRLDGVVLAVPAVHSLAFIVSGGHQRTYRAGDELPVGNRVTLAAVAQDHVRISNNGVEQVLWLDRKGDEVAVSGGPARSPAAAASTADVQPRDAAAPLTQAAPQQIRKVAGRLAEIIEVTPAVSDGRMLGYRLAPGAHLKEFVQLGFRQNDIVTSVNGIALNDMANLPELYNVMNRPADVSFSILRDGQPLTLQMTMAP